ncbi:MAG TPA: hypothetical protein GX509_02245 [Firmicutes bacterium]|nr:hypothetical protein [Bacillota bacterium]HHY97541.1 hypothetical protein [Bacillota bacterium]
MERREHSRFVTASADLLEFGAKGRNCRKASPMSELAAVFVAMLLRGGVSGRRSGGFGQIE